MNVKLISCSQNKGRGHQGNSGKIASVIKSIMAANEMVNEVDTVYLSDYSLSPCTLCGGCSRSHRCVNDASFNNLLEELKNTDLFLPIVPYYSPIPSSLSIVLEKFNQVLVTSHLAKNPLSEDYKQKKIGLIVHGGMVDSKPVRQHYEQMVAKPLVSVFQGLGLEFLTNHTYSYGLCFGLENEGAVTEKEDELFPLIDHRAEYVKETVKDYVKFLESSI